jgi:hypothetical protein
VFARIEKAHALPPAELAKLRAETLAHLQRVKEEGAPYTDAVTAAWREVAGHLPDLHTVARMAGSTLATVAARSAEAAAVHAQDLADKLAAQGAAKAAGRAMHKTQAPDPTDETSDVADEPAP